MAICCVSNSIYVIYRSSSSCIVSLVSMRRQALRGENLFLLLVAREYITPCHSLCSNSIRSKFVRGCWIGKDIGGMIRANAGVIQTDAFTFLQVGFHNAPLCTFCSYNLSYMDLMTHCRTLGSKLCETPVLTPRHPF